MIDSPFKDLVSRQTFNKIRDNASDIAAKTKHANNADIRDTVSPSLNLIS